MATRYVGIRGESGRADKYIYWPDFKREQLFDLSSDPLEEHDLVNDSAFSSQLLQLRNRFAELKAQAL